MTLILGSMGSMGKRYQAILKHLGIPFETYDVRDNTGFGFKDYERFSHFILATPTDTHKMWVRALDKYEKPIFCEKPLSTNMDDVEFILNSKSPLTMQMQYAYFDRDELFAEGASWYDYYNHGKDGLVWDCFQIIALARGEVSLKESSPIWSAGINGQPIDLRQMDKAYIWMVKRFYDHDFISKEKLLNWHKKVSEVEAKWTT